MRLGYLIEEFMSNRTRVNIYDKKEFTYVYTGTIGAMCLAVYKHIVDMPVTHIGGCVIDGHAHINIELNEVSK